jgi:homogentisate 1,2-dioxygenase
MAGRVNIYNTGFGSYFESEATEGALPIGKNSPQKHPLGLYPEQINGSAFTCPRQDNLRTWVYRIQPSVVQSEFEPIVQLRLQSPPFNNMHANPTQMRWDPISMSKEPCHFIQGMVTWAGNGCAESFTGAAIHLYCANQSMDDTYFYNSDGEYLIVPQDGNLCIETELGTLEVIPGEIAVIPRGIKFRVQIQEHTVIRGYVLENFGSPFRLPDLGPIGANGLANPRDFKYPVARYDYQQQASTLITKFQGQLWKADLSNSPLDVVAWHGNYSPYKYDLRCFNTINTVSFDHPDPSIFTVLTSPTDTKGVANLDFAIFPERWMVAEDTFRPPYFHRNIMSEFMGLIYGKYDAKPNGFKPGGCSIHNCMPPHGPDTEAFESASNSMLQAERQEGTLAFMFESKLAWNISQVAFESSSRQKNYLSCWSNFPVMFNAKDVENEAEQTEGIIS